MKKQIIEEIFTLNKNGKFARFHFSDLPDHIQDNDIIDIHRGENNSYDEFSELIISRERQETNYEYEKRIKEKELNKELLRKQRYNQYLKLKEEFETSN